MSRAASPASRLRVLQRAGLGTPGRRRSPTHSRFDAPQVRGDHFEAPFQVGKPIELRGIAFGGRPRDFSKVEISSDDGETWDDAEITKPEPKLSWSLWSYHGRPTKKVNRTGSSAY